MVSHPWQVPVRDDWLELSRETPIEPDLPIVDSHHHLWDMPGRRYRAVDLARDIAESGHRVVATVYIDANSGYLTSGPEHLRSVGETRWVREQSSSVPEDVVRVGAGIVSRTDFRLGDRVREVLEAHVEAGNGRFRGIRQLAVWDADESLTDPRVRDAQRLTQGLLADDGFRRGFRYLGDLSLTFDTWVYSPQLPEVADLADAFPDTQIVVNHCGTPLAQGRYGVHHEETLVAWAASLKELAKRDNVSRKLGGLAKWLTASELHLRSIPPSSEELAREWGPYFEACLDAFGSSRCMFESNFPQEKTSCTYGAFWNACKRLSAGLPPHERDDLFMGTACRVYNLSLPENSGSARDH